MPTIKKDKKPILVKFSIAQTTGDKDVSVYGDWNVIYISDKSNSGVIDRETYGQDEDFDMVIVLEANPITRQVDEKSVFLVDEFPTKNNKKGNYRIKKIFPEYLGSIRIGLETIEKIPYQNLYYLSGSNIYKFQLNYDSETMKGYIDKDIKHPFTTETIIWSSEPTSAENTVDRISFVSDRRVGIIDRYKAFTELTFGEVE